METITLVMTTEKKEQQVKRDFRFYCIGKYDNRYNNKYDKDKDIICIIFNNNSIFTGSDYAIDGNYNLTGTGEKYFTNDLNPEQEHFYWRILV